MSILLILPCIIQCVVCICAYTRTNNNFPQLFHLKQQKFKLGVWFSYKVLVSLYSALDSIHSTTNQQTKEPVKNQKTERNYLTVLWFRSPK